MRSAAIVLVGGRSSRMGTSKAALEWHGSTLLRRVTGLVARAVDGPVVVARAPGQTLPLVGPGVEVVDDPVAGAGPLQGIATGLAAVAGRADTAFVCSVDLPLLHPAYVAAVLRLSDGRSAPGGDTRSADAARRAAATARDARAAGARPDDVRPADADPPPGADACSVEAGRPADARATGAGPADAGTAAPRWDAVIPVALGHPQPLAAAYRTALVPHLRELLAAGRTSPVHDLVDLRVDRPDAARLLADPALAAADPRLLSLTNVNRPGEYAQARALPAPLVTVVWPGGRRIVRAATCGAAAAAVGAVAPDPEAPLVDGDVVDLR